MSVKIRRTLQLALVAVLVLLIGACNRLPPPAYRPPESAPIPLIVHNNHPDDVVIYAVRTGTWQRLGSVISCVTDTLLVPYSATAVGALRLALDPIGSVQRQPLGPIVVLPGDRIELTIEAYLAASSWRILPRIIARAEQQDR